MELRHRRHLFIALILVVSAGCSGPSSPRFKRPDPTSLIATGSNAGIEWEMYWGEGQGECVSMWRKDRDTSTVNCGFDIPSTQQVTASALGPFDEKIIWFGAFDPAATSIKFLLRDSASPKVRVIKKEGLPLKYFVTEMPLDFHGGIEGTRLVIEGQEVVPKEDAQEEER